MAIQSQAGESGRALHLRNHGLQHGRLDSQRHHRMRLERLSAAADGSAVLRASRRVTETSVLVRATIAVVHLSGRAVRRLGTVSKGPVQAPSQDDAAIRRLFLSSKLTTGVDRALVSSVRAWERAVDESAALAIARADLP